MLFSTVQFFIFFAVVLTLYYASPRSFRKPILLAASYFFYMCWNPKFILLLMTLTGIDFAAGLWLSRVRPERRKLVLILSLAANIGFLGFFKYYNFLAGMLAKLLGRPSNSFFLDVILPLGISFHTFQSMSYVIDVYRGDQPPIRNLLDYALFISFFPQLVAGPIVRAQEFFKDLYNWRRPTAEEFQNGALLVGLGLVKKMALADQFAQVADAYFKNVAANPGMLTAWSGTLAFAMQIYFDFSGYTDMAIGMAGILGFHFPVNFRRPYLSASITEFWQRWHISLSRWLRDYLYFSLGGFRRSRWLTYRNLMITMLLGGLWHGASWNFVLWGGFHGACLGLERMVWGNRREPAWWSSLYPLRALITFTLVCLSWVLFRALNFGDAVFVFRQMFTGAPGKFLLDSWHVGLIGLSLVLAWKEEKRGWFHRLSRAPAWAYAAAIAGMLLFLEVFGVTEVSLPFVYFQF